MVKPFAYLRDNSVTATEPERMLLAAVDDLVSYSEATGQPVSADFIYQCLAVDSKVTIDPDPSGPRKINANQFLRPPRA